MPVLDRGVKVQQIFVRDKSFYSKILTISVPLILQNMITIGVNLVDTMMLGQFGEISISASALGGQFCNLYQMLCMGLGFGTVVMTSQYWGRNDTYSFRKAVTLMLRITLVLGLAFTVFSILFPRQVMAIYSNEEAVIADGLRYLSYMAYSFVFHGLSLTVSLVLRSAGKTIVPLFSSIGAFIINIILNWIFIFGNLGAPRMEIAGAALATLVCRIFECIFIVGYFMFFEKDVRYRIKDFFMKCGDLWPEFRKYAVPVIISDALLGLGNNNLTMIMGRIGGDYVAANSIMQAVQRLSTVYSQALSSSGAVVTGNTIGQGDTDKAYRQAVTFVAVSLIAGALGSGIILLVARPMLGLYNVSENTRNIAMQLSYSMAFMMVFQTLAQMLTKGVLRGGGDTKYLMFADIFFLWVASTPLGYLAGIVWQLPAFWIHFFLKIEMVLKSFLGIHRFRTKKWIKEIK